VSIGSVQEAHVMIILLQVILEGLLPPRLREYLDQASRAWNLQQTSTSLAQQQSLLGIIFETRLGRL
jgi:hypothetical protein